MACWLTSFVVDPRGSISSSVSSLSTEAGRPRLIKMKQEAICPPEDQHQSLSTNKPFGIVFVIILLIQANLQNNAKGAMLHIRCTFGPCFENAYFRPLRSHDRVNAEIFSMKHVCIRRFSLQPDNYGNSRNDLELSYSK